ncbi:MAG: Pr6Pr family membrane protein [Clostridiales bacterium]|jgi:hypothetical protein|nr:Pr6Pr family membrane protein [Clostridiales bacterium]
MKKFVRSKGFAAVCLILGCISVTLIILNVAMWKKYLLPYYPAVTANNISGLNYFAYFTILTNLLCAVWLLLYGVGKLFCRKLAERVTIPAVQGALTVYICVVGFIYWGVLVWFTDRYPSELWLFNFIDIYEHFIIPCVFVVMWLCGLNNSKMAKKCLPYFLIYPFSYYTFSIIRGAFIDWYAYPFFNAVQVWKIVGADKPYNAAAAYTLVVAAFAALFGIIVGLSFLARYWHNKRVEREE